MNDIELSRGEEIAFVSRGSGKKYKLVMGKDHVLYCTCMAWRFHKHCKHLDAWSSGKYRIENEVVQL